MQRSVVVLASLALALVASIVVADRGIVRESPPGYGR